MKTKLKEYEVISLYRKAKKGNPEARHHLMIWYEERQYYRVPAEMANIHGIMGFGSISYVADEYRSAYNNEFNQAMDYAVILWLNEMTD